jgi:hypothetical protein
LSLPVIVRVLCCSKLAANACLSPSRGKFAGDRHPLRPALKFTIVDFASLVQALAAAIRN